MGGKKKTHEQFVQEVQDLRGDEYTVLGQYEGSIAKILMRHNTCGHEWHVVAKEFLRGTRCPACFGTPKKTTEKFARELSDMTAGEYSLVGEYKTAKTKVKIKHNVCGHVWETFPTAFRAEKRCLICARKNTGIKQRKTHEQFVEEVKQLVGDEFTVLSEYKTTFTKVLMKHNKCGHEWSVTPASFLSHGNRCPRCSASRGEKAVEQYLKKNGFEYKHQYKIDECRNKRALPFDFAAKINNQTVLIEYDGAQHYMPIEVFGGEKTFKRNQHNDEIKTMFCLTRFIPLIRIPYTVGNVEAYLDKLLKAPKLSIAS